MRCPIAGCGTSGPTVIGTSGEPWETAQDATFLYWNDRGTGVVYEVREVSDTFPRSSAFEEEIAREFPGFAIVPKRASAPAARDRASRSRVDHPRRAAHAT